MKIQFTEGKCSTEQIFGFDVFFLCVFLSSSPLCAHNFPLTHSFDKGEKNNFFSTSNVKMYLFLHRHLKEKRGKEREIEKEKHFSFFQWKVESKGKRKFYMSHM